MTWAPIKKPSGPWRVQPHLLEYESACADFTWDKIRPELDGLPGGHGLNIAHEAVDRHAEGARCDHLAIRWLGQDGVELDLTYADLKERTNRFANVLSRLSVDKGERVFTLTGGITQIDYDREMALVLCEPTNQKGSELYGVVRFAADPDNERAEFAILLRRDMTGMGLGPMLMRRIIDYAKDRGVGELFGDVLAENSSMLRLCTAFGFSKRRDPDEPGVIVVSLAL